MNLQRVELSVKKYVRSNCKSYLDRFDYLFEYISDKTASVCSI